MKKYASAPGKPLTKAKEERQRTYRPPKLSEAKIKPSVGMCSYCGASIPPGAKFCTKCGEAQAGTECPQCGTLNFRNFCSKCGEPLTELGLKAREEALADPRFRKVCALSAELLELREKILALSSEEAQMPKLSESDIKLLSEYASLLDSSSTTTSPKPRTEEMRRATHHDNAMTAEELMKAYEERRAEIDREFALMEPPASFNEYQQRDYYSARMKLNITTTVTTYCDMSGYHDKYWVCNYCGCYHTCPNDCAEPWHGGRWVACSIEEYIEKNTVTQSTTTYSQSEDK